MGFPPRCPDPTSKVRRRREQTTHRKSLIFCFHPYSPSSLPSQHFYFPSHPISHIPVPHNTPQHLYFAPIPSQPPPPTSLDRTHHTYTMISRSTLYSLDFIFRSSLPVCLACGVVVLCNDGLPRGFHVHLSYFLTFFALRTWFINPIRSDSSLLSDPTLLCCLLLVRSLMASVRYTALCWPVWSVFILFESVFVRDGRSSLPFIIVIITVLFRLADVAHVRVRGKTRA